MFSTTAPQVLSHRRAAVVAALAVAAATLTLIVLAISGRGTAAPSPVPRAQPMYIGGHAEPRTTPFSSTPPLAPATRRRP